MKNIQIGSKTYTKSSFGKRWSEITSKNVHTKIIDEDYQFIDFAVGLVPKFAKIINSKEIPLTRVEGYSYVIGSKKFHNKSVKGIILITPNSKNKVWVGKGAVIDAIFPNTTKTESVKNKQKALQALRQIIQPQIDMYKKSVQRQIASSTRFRIKCAITHQTLEYGEFHIDHVYPFKMITEDWCKATGVDLENLEVYCRGTKCYLKITELAESFYDYHLLYAKLQPVTIKANLSKGSKIL